MPAQEKVNFPCLVCDEPAPLLDVVDMNKSCMDNDGAFLELSGKPVYYARCGSCGFVFAPQFQSWSDQDFLANIYNDDYEAIDPDYVEARPSTNFEVLTRMFGQSKGEIRHLDYGGGNGKLSAKLAGAGWNSVSYDPFPAGTQDMTKLGKFNLITAFEVFEHVPQPAALMRNLVALMDGNACLVLFSTLVSDKHVEARKRLTWWYAAPRNGHISLFTSKSLERLAQAHGLGFGSFSEAVHCYMNAVPKFASHILN